MTSEWGNFENWLNSPQGWIFYLVLVVTVVLVPILLDFVRLRRASSLDRFPAILLWTALGLLPIIAVTGPFMYFPPGAILMLTAAMSLFAGVVILRWTRRTERFPAILVWIGLSLLPVILVVPFVTWWYFPSVGLVLLLISAALLFAGVAILRLTERTERLPALLIWAGLGLPPVIPVVVFVPWWYLPSVGAMCMICSAVPLVGGLIILAIAKANAAEIAFRRNSSAEPHFLCSTCGGVLKGGEVCPHCGSEQI